MTRSPIVYFLFLLSGITALIYEVVWTRMLTLAFGHTVFSVSIVLAAFMAGLGLGSYFSGHAIDHPGGEKTYLGGNKSDEGLSEDLGAPSLLLVYGWIEILLFFACSIVSLILFKFSTVYSWLSFFIPDFWAIQNVVKFLLAFVLMSVPRIFDGRDLTGNQ